MEFQDAIKQVRQLAKMTEALSTVIAQADALTQSESTVKEHDTRVQKLKAEAQQIAADNTAAKGEAHDTITQARNEAAEIVSQAKAKADVLTSAARTKADTMLVGAACDSAEMEAAAKAAEERLATLQGIIDIKTAEATELEKRIEKAQAQINKMLGG